MTGLAISFASSFPLWGHDDPSRYPSCRQDALRRAKTEETTLEMMGIGPTGKKTAVPGPGFTNISAEDARDSRNHRHSLRGAA